MNYSEMSDHQINVLVAKALDGHADDKFPVQRRLQVFDPCNSWADGGPIIHKGKFSLEMDNTEAFWICTGFSENEPPFMENHENPLRAGMVVFLMMNEAENANS